MSGYALAFLEGLFLVLGLGSVLGMLGWAEQAGRLIPGFVRGNAPLPRALVDVTLRPVDVDITDLARAVWTAIWPREPWPQGWSAAIRCSVAEPVFAQWPVPIASSQGMQFVVNTTYGVCDRVRRIVLLNHDLLVDPDGHDPLYTLVHELLHVRGHNHHIGGLAAVRHFDRRTRAALSIAWKAAL